MGFDVHKNLRNRDDWIDEKRAEAYVDSLIELFAESPEGQELFETEEDLAWAAHQIRMAMEYESVTPPETSPASLWAVLFEWFPRKISAPSSEAPSIVRQVHALWRFLDRGIGLENARACLEIFDGEDLVERLRSAMDDPRNFGPAKTFAMFAREAGFDLATEEGTARAMLAYNARLAANPSTPRPVPPGRFSITIPPAGSPSAGAGEPAKKESSTKRRKSKRKSAKVSRRRNRRKR